MKRNIGYWNNMTESNGFSAVDLFCGIGGLTHGLIKAGIPVKAGIDIDEGCKYPFEINNNIPFIRKDVSILSSKEVLDLYDDPDKKILVGCAPCQPFSSYTQNNKKRDEDVKWKLLYSFARIVRSIEPEIISMENVPNAINFDPFKDFLSTLKKMKYNVKYTVVRCEEYGVPQRRKRLVLLASRLGEISFPDPIRGPSDYVSVRDVIGVLEKLDHGCISESDPLHKAQRLSQLNLKRIKVSKPGSTWADWTKDLLCKCHKRKRGLTYKSVYGRMEWDKPSPTITTQFYNYGSGRFGHPEENRALSLREGALLQTFPRDYIFANPTQKVPITYQRVGRYIGNAVPVKLGEIIGSTILDHIKRCSVDQ
jgi:DNA (cytosine-5)-methyltransferase 1